MYVSPQVMWRSKVHMILYSIFQVQCISNLVLGTWVYQWKGGKSRSSESYDRWFLHSKHIILYMIFWFLHLMFQLLFSRSHNKWFNGWPEPLKGKDSSRLFWDSLKARKWLSVLQFMSSLSNSSLTRQAKVGFSGYTKTSVSSVFHSSNVSLRTF